MNLELAATGLGVGFLVGLTGMGGGALMTPLLILVFGVPPLAAVSSDLVTSLLMKPVGAWVHLRRGTVDWRLVRWLAVGAVPAGFAGVLLLKALGDGQALQTHLKQLIGAVLLFSVATTLVGNLVRRDGPEASDVRVHPVRTIVIGVVGGLCVGMTSVGAGSVVITLLLLAHPGLKTSRLVGTDLVQAIPLVAAATVGHALFGDVRIDLTVSLLIGALPGVYLGARLSARGRNAALKPTILTVLLASALALVRVPTPALLVACTAFALVVGGHAIRPIRFPMTPAPAGRAEEI